MSYYDPCFLLPEWILALSAAGLGLYYLAPVHVSQMQPSEGDKLADVVLVHDVHRPWWS